MCIFATPEQEIPVWYCKVSGKDKCIMHYSVSTYLHSLLRAIGHLREVTTVDWSPLTPHHLISGGKDGAVKVLNSFTMSLI